MNGSRLTAAALRISEDRLAEIVADLVERRHACDLAVMADRERSAVDALIDADAPAVDVAARAKVSYVLDLGYAAALARAGLTLVAELFATAGGALDRQHGG